MLLVCVNTTCSAQTVRIRVVDVTNGSPIPKQQISVSGLYGKELILVTDANGEVQFELPKPSSAQFAVRADINYARWYCACLAFVTTAEVIQKGFMAKAPDDDANFLAYIEKAKIRGMIFCFGK